MKKMMSLILALLMLIAPAATMAQAAACDASFVIADPVFTFGDEATGAETIDLTGLALAVKLATTAEIPGVTIDLSANGATAFSAVIEQIGDQIIATLTGMTTGVTIALDDAAQLASGAVASSPFNTTGIMSAFEDYINSIQFEDAGKAEAEFYGGGKLNANKQNLVVPEEAMTALVEQIVQMSGEEMPTDFSMAVTGSIYSSDDAMHQRIDLLYDVTAEGETIAFPFTILMYEPNEETVYAKVNSTVEDTVIDGNFMLAPIEGLDASNVFADITVTESGEILGTVQLTCWAEETADGLKKLFNFTVSDPSDPVRVQGSVLSGDNLIQCDLLVQAGGDTSHIAFNGAPVITDGMIGIGGELTLNLQTSDGPITGKLNLTAAQGGTVDLPDLAALTLIDIANMTEDDMMSLQTEAQTLLFRGLGQLMSIPGLQSLMADMM